jgi:MarR family transcriptional regulator, lower aerobic nicotinate degradation pathway regulator
VKTIIRLTDLDCVIVVKRSQVKISTCLERLASLRSDSSRRHSLLNRLKEQPGLSGVDIARHTFISPQAAHVALRTLEQKDLIGRQTDPQDGRTVLSVVTPAGEAILSRCAADIREIASDLAAPLTHGQRQTLIELLSRYIESPTD